MSILVSSLIVFGCDDLIVPDISDEEINFLSPVKDTVNTSELFIWLEYNQKDIDKVSIQIVRPSFSQLEDLMYDTLVSSEKSYYALPANDNYEIRVRGLNSAYQTEYYYKKVYINE
ncbi:hypothetical protein [Mangrovivirga cuniculi]|uniref:hypothetical protein n=1 Tax=Mangrovivirga cuniculi TaxID=2715131 RepID=UPI001586EBB5|nr:hypothetical protein [Mangrovivirga cuniculi]